MKKSSTRRHHCLCHHCRRLPQLCPILSVTLGTLPFALNKWANPPMVAAGATATASAVVAATILLDSMTVVAIVSSGHRLSWQSHTHVGILVVFNFNVGRHWTANLLHSVRPRAFSSSGILKLFESSALGYETERDERGREGGRESSLRPLPCEKRGTLKPPAPACV